LRGGDQANSEHCIDHAGTLNCDKGQQGGIVAFHPTQDPISSVDGSTHAMGCGSKGGCCTQAVAVSQGFTYSGYSNQPAWMTGDRTDWLPASGHSDGSHQGMGVVCGDGDTVGTIRSNTRNNSDPVTEAAMHVMHGMAVRRLTPKECERLQGFPDGYTDVTYRGKPATDGPRYRALGNSMAVPVMAWIGQRIQMAKEAKNG